VSNEGEWEYEDWDQPREGDQVSTFTREQLEDFQAVAYNHPLDGYRNTVQDLAAFALAMLDEKEKTEAERDEARAMKVPATTEAVMLAEMGEKVARTEAWAAKEELRIAEAERDRLREELLGAKVAWDMCDAVNGRLREGLREATALLSDAATEMEASGGWDGDEDLFDRIMTYLRTRERKEKEE